MVKTVEEKIEQMEKIQERNAVDLYQGILTFVDKAVNRFLDIESSSMGEKKNIDRDEVRVVVDLKNEFIEITYGTLKLLKERYNLDVEEALKTNYGLEIFNDDKRSSTVSCKNLRFQASYKLLHKK